MNEVCEWIADSNNEYEAVWNTSCHNAFVIIDGTPESNGFVYCAYCGKPLKQVQQEQEQEEDE